MKLASIFYVNRQSWELAEGDTVVVEIDRIGLLRSPIADEAAG